MTRDQVIGVMAAAIYSVRSAANPDRHRLDSLQKDAVREAVALFDKVLERNDDA